MPTTRINSAIQDLKAEKTEPHWEQMHDSSVASQKQRVRDIMLRVWPKDQPSWFDHVFCDTSDVINKSWDKMHDRFFEAWNRGCEKIGATFLKTKFFHWHVDLPPESREEAIQDLFDEMRPWWDFFGWVTKRRIEKVESLLDEYISQTKIENFKSVKDSVDKMVEKDKGPSEIVEMLRNETKAFWLLERWPDYDVSYYSDDELYLIAHLVLKKEDLVPGKSWSEWKLAGLKKLFKREGIPFEIYSELQKMDSTELDKAVRQFEITAATWNVRKMLWEIGERPLPKQLSNPLFRAAMYFERNQLWNCLPGEVKDSFEKIIATDVYKEAVELDLMLYLQKELDEQVKNKDDPLIHIPEKRMQCVKSAFIRLLAERFGDYCFEALTDLEAREGGRVQRFHVQIYTANRQPLSFLVSLETPEGSGNQNPIVEVERVELKDIGLRDVKPVLPVLLEWGRDWWKQFTQSDEDRARDRVFGTVFGQFKKAKERTERFKEVYAHALDLFKAVAEQDMERGDLKGPPLAGLKVDFAKIALKEYPYGSLLAMRDRLELFLLAVEAKGKSKIEDKDQTVLEEVEKVHAFLKQLCEIKQHEKMIREGLPAVETALEGVSLPTITLEEMSDPTKSSEFRSSFASIDWQLKKIDHEFKQWNLEVLDVANPELAKNARLLMAEFEKKKNALQPYRMILDKQQLDNFLKYHREIEGAIEKIRIEFPLEDKGLGLGVLLQEDSNVKSLLRGILLLESKIEILRNLPAFDVMEPLIAEVERCHDEIYAYKLTLNMFVVNVFGPEGAVAVRAALFENKDVDKILNLLDELLPQQQPKELELGLPAPSASNTH